MTAHIILPFLAMTLSVTSFAGALKDCEYYKTQVMKVGGGNGASCDPAKLCYAEILCTKTLPSGNDIDVTRNIVCALDSTGQCPSVETCRADKTTATFEKEAQVGGSHAAEYVTFGVQLAPIIAEMLLRKQTGQPLEPAIERLKEIKEPTERAK